MRMTQDELDRLEAYGPSHHGWGRLIAEVRACWIEMGRRPDPVRREGGQTHLHCWRCRQWHPVDFSRPEPLRCPTCAPRRTT